MEKLLEKITSYNVFNYFLPGVIFAFLVERYTDLILLSGETYKDVFIIYFIGLIISRIGSVIIEPILTSIKFVDMGTYKNYVCASKLNTKVETLNEVNNTYRSILTSLIAFCIIYYVNLLGKKIPFLETIITPAIIVFAIIVMLFAFRKQSKYLKNCAEYTLSENKNDTGNSQKAQIKRVKRKICRSISNTNIAK